MDFDLHVGGSPASPDAVRLLQPTPRTFGRNRQNKDQVPSDWRQQLTEVEIYVESGKGLPKQDLLKASNPYVVVKGIRSNTHLVDLFKTQVERGTVAPIWDERFLYTCPDRFNGADIVGLRFLVYDASHGEAREAGFLGNDDFLGGADVDLVEQGSGRTVRHELELAGMFVRKNRGAHHKKPRLTVEVKVWREYRPQPPSATSVLLNSLAHYTRATEIKGRVISAQGLRNADWTGKSDPYCVVRAIMISGKVETLHRTRTVQDCLEPVWDESFTVHFKPEEEDDDASGAFDSSDDGRGAGVWDKEDVFGDEPESDWSDLVKHQQTDKGVFRGEEPVLLAFDVFDVDEGGLMEDFEDDHLGTAYIALTDCISDRELFTLKLEGETSLLEGRLGVNGGTTKRLVEEDHHIRKSFIGKDRFLTRGKNLDKEMKRSLLAIELSVQFEEVPMPLVELVYKGPREMGFQEQAGPGVIGAFDDLSMVGKKNHRRVLKGREKIVFIHGVILGASGLANADAFGKSDPYAIVMGVSNDGQRVFIHRTRHINNSLTPIWNEVFSMAVDPLEEIHKLLITVWDSDNDGVIAAGGDDFLGHATLDLSSLMSGEKLRDELSLLGVKRVRAQGGAKAASGFIRDATVSIEVRVQRRVQAYIEFLEEEKLKVRPRHQQSRDPPTAAEYNDISQEDIFAKVPQARKVLELHNMGLLSTLGRKKVEQDHGYALRWLEAPRKGRRCLAPPPDPLALKEAEKDNQLFLEVDLKDKVKNELPPGTQHGVGSAFSFGDSGTSLPRPMTSSLPALATRFEKPRTATPKAWRPPRFRDDSNRQSEILHGMQHKLPPSLLSQPVRSISTF